MFVELIVAVEDIQVSLSGFFVCTEWMVSCTKLIMMQKAKSSLISDDRCLQLMKRYKK